MVSTGTDKTLNKNLNKLSEQLHTLSEISFNDG